MIRLHFQVSPPQMENKCIIVNTRKVNVKVKLSPWMIKYHAMKTYGGNGGIAPYILNIGSR
jgi:hypothetical protein